MESRVKWSPLTKALAFNVGKNPIHVQWRVIASDMGSGEFFELSQDEEWDRICQKATRLCETGTLHRRENAAKQLQRYVEKRRHEIRRALFLQSVSGLRQPAA